MSEADLQRGEGSPSDDDLLTVHQAAALLRIDVQTVYKLALKGTLVPTARRPLLFTIAAVKRYLADHSGWPARYCRWCGQPLPVREPGTGGAVRRTCNAACRGAAWRRARARSA